LKREKGPKELVKRGQSLSKKILTSAKVRRCMGNLKQKETWKTVPRSKGLCQKNPRKTGKRPRDGIIEHEIKGHQLKHRCPRNTKKATVTSQEKTPGSGGSEERDTQKSAAIQKRATQYSKGRTDRERRTATQIKEGGNCHFGRKSL